MSPFTRAAWHPEGRPAASGPVNCSLGRCVVPIDVERVGSFLEDEPTQNGAVNARWSEEGRGGRIRGHEPGGGFVTNAAEPGKAHAALPAQVGPHVLDLIVGGQSDIEDPADATLGERTGKVDLDVDVPVA